jgi:hypothetical protein
MFNTRLPLLPEECDIIVMRRTGVNEDTDQEIYQDF